MKKLAFLLIATLVYQNSAAQTLRDTLAKIETIFAPYTTQTPGCQLAIARRGQVVFSGAWGLADLEHGIRLSPQSIIEAGSVAKQFTAAAILLLEQQGRLSLDDDVRKHIPELPNYGHPIRLRHLLYHTSGIKDWGFLAFLTGWPRTQKFYSNQDALDFIVHQKSLNNEPGAEHLYSNSNYNLLAVIIQRVSGRSLADFTRQHIFEPAGMAHTQWRDNPNRIVWNRALAYRKVENGYQTDMPNEYAYGNGGVLTTSEDLLKWQEFYLRGKMGTASLLAKQTHTEPLTNGGKNDYAAGLEILHGAGAVENISHSGATAGYRAYLEVFPKSGFALAVLSNTSQTDVLSVATAVRNIFMTPPPVAATNREAAVQVPLATLNAYTGWYKNSRDGSAMQLAVKDGILLADHKVRLLAQAANRFAMGEEVVEIEGTQGLRVIDASSDTVRYSKAAPARASDDVTAYVGKYFSEETASFLTISQSGGQLKLSFKPAEEHELLPTVKEGFVVPTTGSVLNFTKSKKRQIILKISVPRARNVEFVKLPASK